MKFIDKGTVIDCLAVDEDTDNNDGNKSNRASHIGTSQSQKYKE